MRAILKSSADYMRSVSIGILVGLPAGTIFGLGINACHPQDQNTQQRVLNTIDLAGYQGALDQCRAKGKDAGSYDVYETCAKEADKKYGKEKE